jgi:hypothetical protein
MAGPFCGCVPGIDIGGLDPVCGPVEVPAVGRDSRGHQRDPSAVGRIDHDDRRSLALVPDPALRDLAPVDWTRGHDWLLKQPFFTG